MTRTGVALLLMLGVTVTVSVLSMTDVFVYTPDSARYLIWGQSLARFEGYVDKSGPETARYVVHAPLFSLFLVPALWVSSPIIAAKAVNIVFVILVLVLMFLFVRAEHGDASALAAIGFLFLNPLLILFSTQILSDLAFVAAILLIFILAGRMMNLPHHHSLPRILSYAVLLSCAVLLRELGIAILVAVGAAM
ncbi:MAG: hypothetical protein HYW57_02160, partial [Ignavibacteriales bacterium]|nr:hypothetical protein [Ignavibacteriales bacterium]